MFKYLIYFLIADIVFALIIKKIWQRNKIAKSEGLIHLKKSECFLIKEENPKLFSTHIWADFTAVAILFATSIVFTLMTLVAIFFETIK